MAKNILVTGCSGGGKSTLIERLKRLGQAVVREPGLRVIQSGGPKPWEDIPAFVEAVTKLSHDDLQATRDIDGIVFFDRGLFDALSGKAEREKKAVSELLPAEFPYAEPVFFAPPWPEIFENTAERQLPFEVAHAETVRLRRDLDLLGVRTVELRKVSVTERVDLVLEELGLS